MKVKGVFYLAQVVNVQPNGNAPAGLSPGDYVNTQGGMYMVAQPGSAGATYNPESGYWSVRADGNNSDAVRQSSVQSALSTAQSVAAANSALSQSYAREQMAFQRESNAKAMAFNAEQAQINRDWQERMSNTAHQREVRDLLAAGLNPILSAMGGSGAAVTSGATASGVTSSGAQGSVDQNYTSLVGSLANTMINAQTSLDIAKIQAMVNEYMADSSRAAALGSASINAASLLERTQMEIDNPQTLWGNFNSVIRTLGDILDSGSISNGSSVGRALNGLTNGITGSELYKNVRHAYRVRSGNTSGTMGYSSR